MLCFFFGSLAQLRLITLLDFSSLPVSFSNRATVPTVFIPIFFKSLLLNANSSSPVISFSYNMMLTSSGMPSILLAQVLTSSGIHSFTCVALHPCCVHLESSNCCTKTESPAAHNVDRVVIMIVPLTFSTTISFVFPLANFSKNVPLSSSLKLSSR